MRSDPELIFMLTRADRTVADALQRFAEVADIGLRTVGFKDVGLPLEQLAELARAIRHTGRTVALEVVSLDRSSEIASARAAVQLEVDLLLGGTRPDDVLPVIAGTGIHYFPFPGGVEGHPSRLRGTLAEIVDSARRLAGRAGVAGLDLLAYRWVDGDPAALLQAVCGAVGKPVVAAGSIDRPERLRAVARAGAAAFTVGSAAFDGSFSAPGPGLRRQLVAILDGLRRLDGVATEAEGRPPVCT